jgi:hypothetical protein
MAALSSAALEGKPAQTVGSETPAVGATAAIVVAAKPCATNK